MGRSRRLDLSAPYTPTRYSSGYGLRIAQDQPQHSQTLGGHAQYPAPTQTAPPENAEEGWMTPKEDAGYEAPESSQSVELPPTPPAEKEEVLPASQGNAYIPWIPVRYKDEELNNPKPISTQELLAGFARMNVRDVPPHQFGTSSNFETERTGDGPDAATDGWGAQPQHRAEAGRGWNTARGPQEARRGCFECGEDGHMARECPVRASQGGGGRGGYGGNGSGISKFGAGNECRRCGQEGHWAKECPSGSGFECYNCGETGHMSRDCSEPRKPRGDGINIKCFNCQGYGHMSRECPATQGGPRESAMADNDEDWGFKIANGAADNEGWGSSPIPDPASQIDSQHDAPVISTGHGDHFDAPAHVHAPEPVAPRAPIGMHPDRARRLGVPVVPQDDPRQASHGPVQQWRQQTTAVLPPPAPAAQAVDEDNEFGGW